MLLELILLQFIAHLSADFIFQSNGFIHKKCASIFNRYHLYHFFIVGGLSYLCSLDFHFWGAALIIAGVHLFTDVGKGIWQISTKGQQTCFFIDQCVHITSFIIVAWGYSTFCGIRFLVPMDIKILAIIAGFLFCSKPANILIMNIFRLYSIQTDNEHCVSINSLPNAGRLIGVVERFLALAMVILTQYEAVGLLIAAKSILRFSDTQKTEYVLVGTLLSFAVALFTGVIINILG